MTRPSKKARQIIEGRNLRRLRDAQGWTQDVLAAKVATDKRYISAMEKGSRGIGPDMMGRFCEVFKVDESEFSGGAIDGPLHDNPYINQFLQDLIGELSLQTDTEILRKIADLKEAMGKIEK